MHKQLVDMIIESGKDSGMKLLHDKFIAMLDRLKEVDHEYYHKIEDCLYVEVYGEHLNESMAHKWVDNMANKDGSIGAHWSIDETNQVAKQIGVPFDDFNNYEWYAIMNMLFSDYYGSVSSDTMTYAKLAKDWLMDKDVSPGKAYRYYRYVVCKE